MINVIRAAASCRMLLFGIAVGALNVYMAGCAETGKAGAEEREMAAKTIQEVLQEHTEGWLSIPGVVGTAIGEFEGKPCIRILVVEKTEELMKQIPLQVEGFPVVVTESGEIRALR